MEILEPDKVDYRIRQSREDLRYTADYRAWVESLPDDERAQLAALGLEQPHAPGYSSGVGISGDAADNAIAEEIVAPDPDEKHDWKVAADLRCAEVVGKLISELLANDATLATECLALVCGIGYTGASENAIAKRYGVSRAAVSKRCIELAERLGVKNFRAMKSDLAREVYAERAVEVHRQAGRIATEPPRGRRIETIAGLASRIAGIWRRIQKPQWVRDTTAAELLVVRRSLRPAFQVAADLERMIREQADPAILAELDRDLAGQA
jgi:hypothetical protein